MAPGEGTYKCTLDEKTLKKARDELNEIPEERASQIDPLRNWVKSQPHITCRTDDDFLLRFLRVSKFSQLKAQERLDNFCSVRSSPSTGVPDWFDKLDPLGEKMQQLLDQGISIPLGKDDQGRTVLFNRVGAYDAAEVSLADIMRLGFVNTEVMLLDEELQVHGIVVLLDFGDLTSSHMFTWSIDNVQKASRCWSDVYPTRNKAVNYWNTGTLFNAVYELFKIFMKEKMKQRLHFHKSDLSSLHQQVPVRILPEELGGTAGSLKDTIQNWKKHVVENREEILRNMACKVDETKRPKAEASGGGWGVVGSFRKLAV